jgi:hypothetical protein
MSAEVPPAKPEQHTPFEGRIARATGHTWCPDSLTNRGRCSGGNRCAWKALFLRHADGRALEAALQYHGAAAD